MREIKFRAWDSENKVFAFVGFDILGETTVFDMVRGYQLEKLVKLDVSQFTGLKDKNGKEIYEGDIIKAEYGIGKVEFNELSASYKYVFKLYSDDLWFYSNGCEVIGNIYQNPELLN